MTITVSCPRCSGPLAPEAVRTDANYCMFCSGEFEARIFRPPTRPAPVVAQLETAGPEEVAACANHQRNAAVTSCQRCGLLICSLCDMNVGEGSYCPACFERVRSEGSSRLAVTRMRDHGAIARLAVLLGFLAGCFAPLIAPVGIYSALKGIKQHRAAGGGGIVGLVVVLVLAILELVGSVAFYAFMGWTMFNSPGGGS